MCTKNKDRDELKRKNFENSLRPLLGNITMTELKQKVFKKFAGDINKFYKRYIDDTLSLVTSVHSDLVHMALKNFRKKLRFTVDTF